MKGGVLAKFSLYHCTGCCLWFGFTNSDQSGRPKLVRVEKGIFLAKTTGSDLGPRHQMADDVTLLLLVLGGGTSEPILDG